MSLPVAHTILDVAKAARLGRSKIYEEIRHGRLKARKIGSRTIILDDDLRSWLASLPSASDCERDKI